MLHFLGGGGVKAICIRDHPLTMSFLRPYVEEGGGTKTGILRQYSELNFGRHWVGGQKPQKKRQLCIWMIPYLFLTHIVRAILYNLPM